MFDQQKQFETMAILRAYASHVAQQLQHDLRPTTAHYWYKEPITRMAELVKLLESSKNG